MIPIRDTVPSKNVPVVNNLIIGINVVMFAVQLMQGSDAGFHRLIYYYGLVPARYTMPGGGADVTGFQQVFALISFMFLHGGFLHLLGNMWSLYIFGDNVEDRLGPLRYIVFYLLCGLTSGLAHLLFNASSSAPTIGASGAVAGVMGAYFLLHPKSRILTLIPLFFIPLFFEIPAFVFLGIWFLFQLLHASTSSGSAGGIAWWAHVGGFIFGIILLKLFVRLPSAGMTGQIRKMTVKKKTHRFQVLRPVPPDQDEIHSYATITISPYEALVGTRKLVNIPAGFQRRIYRVNVPPGIKQGQLLRLKGQGKALINGRKGDLMLKVIIQ